MRVLLLCKRHYTNRDLVGERFGRLYYLPRELARRGHRVVVLAADYRGRREASLVEGGLEIRTVPLRSLRVGRFVRDVLVRLVAAPPALVVASADTTFGVAGLLAARALRVPFAFDVYDDYRLFASARLLRGLPVFERLVRHADLTVFASRALERRFVGKARRTLVVANGVDPARFRPTDAAGARVAAGLTPASRVVGYFGSIERHRGVELLIEAVGALWREDPRLRLLIAGRNALGLDLSAPWVDYRGDRPPADIPALLSACSVAVIPYESAPQIDVSAPCKLAEYLACGVPVVATRVSDLPALLAAAPEALCAPGDLPGLVAALRRQLTRPVRVPLPPELSWSALGATLEHALVTLRAGRREP